VGNNAFKNFYESCDGSGPSSVSAALRRDKPRPSPPLGGRGSGTTPLGFSTFRVVYQEDIVARIPHLPKISDPYRHVGTEVFISADCVRATGGQEIIAPGWARLLWSDVIGIYRAWRSRGTVAFMDEALADHHISNYVGSLGGGNCVTATIQPSGTNDL
jgi:hypothetical protein